MSYSHTNFIYSMTPAARPTTARTAAALPLYLATAPFAVELGLLLDEVPVAPVPPYAALELPLLAVEPLAFAAAWNASKVLAAVGLTANTIPATQWPV